MALQLLSRLEVRDFLTWKAAFEAAREQRETAGLSVLQIWRETDNSHQVFVLMRVNDIADARAYIASPATEAEAQHAGIAASEHHLLETL